MKKKEKPKSTSYEYGKEYQLGGVEKYRNRAKNHWKFRVGLAERLVTDFVLPKLNKPDSQIVLVDVGCSIGTFAIEFAKKGYRSYGVDFDPYAIEIANELASEEGVHPVFTQFDIADWTMQFPHIDIAICFDIFEHLHDDELGALLQSLRRQLSENGCVVFHTYPSQYDYLFYNRPYLRIPMLFLRHLPVEAFYRIARIYAALVDAGLILMTGKDHSERIKSDAHCNLLTVSRLTDIFQRAGFTLELIESDNLFPMHESVLKKFKKHPISYRNIYGVAFQQK